MGRQSGVRGVDRVHRDRRSTVVPAVESVTALCRRGENLQLTVYRRCAGGRDGTAVRVKGNGVLAGGRFAVRAVPVGIDRGVLGEDRAAVDLRAACGGGVPAVEGVALPHRIVRHGTVGNPALGRGRHLRRVKLRFLAGLKGNRVPLLGVLGIRNQTARNQGVAGEGMLRAVRVPRDPAGEGVALLVGRLREGGQLVVRVHLQGNHRLVAVLIHKRNVGILKHNGGIIRVHPLGIEGGVPIENIALCHRLVLRRGVRDPVPTRYLLVARGCLGQIAGQIGQRTALGRRVGRHIGRIGHDRAEVEVKRDLELHGLPVGVQGRVVRIGPGGRVCYQIPRPLFRLGIPALELAAPQHRLRRGFHQYALVVRLQRDGCHRRPAVRVLHRRALSVRYKGDRIGRFTGPLRIQRYRTRTIAACRGLGPLLVVLGGVPAAEGIAGVGGDGQLRIFALLRTLQLLLRRGDFAAHGIIRDVVGRSPDGIEGGCLLIGLTGGGNLFRAVCRQGPAHKGTVSFPAWVFRDVCAVKIAFGVRFGFLLCLAIWESAAVGIKGNRVGTDPVGVNGGVLGKGFEPENRFAARGFRVPVVKMITGPCVVRVRPLVGINLTVCVGFNNGLVGGSALFGVIPVKGDGVGLRRIDVKISVAVVNFRLRYAAAPILQTPAVDLANAVQNRQLLQLVTAVCLQCEVGGIVRNPGDVYDEGNNRVFGLSGGEIYPLCCQCGVFVDRGVCCNLNTMLCFI